MESNKHHHHHHHHRDGASEFKYRSLNSMELRKKISKVLKIIMTVIAVLMVCVVIYAYLFG